MNIKLGTNSLLKKMINTSTIMYPEDLLNEHLLFFIYIINNGKEKSAFFMADKRWTTL